MNRYYQQGGEMEQLMQLFQAFADAVQDDEFSTAEEVMQMFQQLSPQEQQQFVQQAMQIVQQEQSEAPEQEQMELEEEPVMQYGGYINDTGYLEGYETSNNPYNIIPSNRITMKGVDPKIKYIKGTDNLGNTQYMEHGGEYEFDGDFVLEEPVYAQKGKKILDTYDKVKKPLTYLAGASSIGMGVNKPYSNKESDSMFEDFVEIFDPTGISSYDDVYRAYQRYKKGDESVLGLGLEVAGAVPVLGKFGKAAKLAPKTMSAFTKGLKYLDLIGDSASVLTLPFGDYNQTGGYTYMKAGGDPYYEKLLKNPEVQELKTLRDNKKVGYLKDIKRFNELEGKYGTTLSNAEKQYNRIKNKNTQVEEKPKLQVNRKGFTKEERLEYDKLLKEEKIQNLAIEKSLREEDELNRLIKEEADANAKKQLQIDAAIKRKATIAAKKEAERIAGLKAQVDSKRFFYKKGKNVPLEDLSVYGTRALMTKSNLPKITPKKLLDNTINAIPGKSKLSKLATAAGILTAAYNLGNPFAMEDDEQEIKPNQIIPENKVLNSQNKGIDYQRIFGGKQEIPFEFFPKTDTKSTSLKQDKPKTTLPNKKLNKAVAEQVATPDVLVPPPVPTEVPEELNYDFRVPLMDVGNYYIPQEEREVNINPNVFNRTNIGVGKRFFKQYGGATQTNFKSRFNPNADINIGAETEQQFYQPYIQKMRLFPKIAEPELDPINQYDTMPMGVNSRNYEAPNAQSRSMFEGKGSNQLLDLSNYASRFDEDNFGMTTNPISNQAVNRKSKFEEFMDKYGKKSDLEFNPNVNQVAPYYNLMKASEPLAGQYRANVDLKYAETPLLDPLPVIQQIQNQQRLATQNINTNSPTGQSYLSNLTAQTQQKTMEVLNDIQQKNQQIAAQNEQARINAYNQEMQLNIAANQQYLQNQMQAQAAKDLAMGEALSTIDQMQANKVKEKNYFNSLAATTPGLKKSTNLSNMITGTQGFDVDKDYQKLYYSLAAAKTPEEREAIFKASQEALKRSQDTAKAVTKQIGGSINQFLKRK